MTQAHDAEDPILEATIERVLAENRAMIPPAMVEEYRRLLRLGLATHPAPLEVLKRLRRRPEMQESGNAVLPHAVVAPKKDTGEGQR